MHIHTHVPEDAQTDANKIPQNLLVVVRCSTYAWVFGLTHDNNISTAVLPKNSQHTVSFGTLNSSDQPAGTNMVPVPMSCGADEF